MMREILFRGKRIDNGEWVEVQTLVVIHQDDNDLIFMPQHGEDVTADPMEGNDRALTSIYGNYYQILPQTVGQYTGLTDKNGRKIFDGDIIKAADSFPEYSLMVIRAEGYGYFMDYYFGGEKHDTEQIRGADWFLSDEVIGNVHDNSELLEAVRVAKAATNKQIQALPKSIRYSNGSGVVECPICGEREGVCNWEPNYCPNCGQALDWSGI